MRTTLSVVSLMAWVAMGAHEIQAEIQGSAARREIPGSHAAAEHVRLAVLDLEARRPVESRSP